MKLISTNPAKNYEIVGEVEVSTIEDVRSKIASARAALVSWSALSVRQRIDYLSSFVTIARKRVDDLAKIISLETGRPLTTSYANIESGFSYFQGYFDFAERCLAPKVVFEDEKNIHTQYKEPWGVAACISPWNFPFLNIAWQCGQPLLAGNTIVFKNSEENPLFTKLLEEMITESNLPKGVFNVLYGDGTVGDWLVHEDVDIIFFTGSTKTGQYLTKVAAEKFIPIHLELGGSSPGIVFEDANVDRIVESVFNARFDNSGQYCDGLKRLIVHESLYDKMVQKLKGMAIATKVGDPFAKGTDLGPLIAKRQLELLESQVADAIQKGAKVVAGGKRLEGLNGAYYLPTLLTNVTREMRVWKEEVFGPVLSIVSFTSEEEAIKMANDTIYGLNAYVYTENKQTIERVASRLKCGLITSNNANAFSPATPFGGYKKSGMGRQNGEVGFEMMVQIKVVAEEK